MGRRSTKTTKTGKFMNPTDQWRKQCRKKELKKNRVQRTAVREAVIKSKNPQQLLAEIEEIEKMEIEAGTEEIPSDKGLKEKKRKLHETLQRIVDFYEKEDYNKAQQIKTFIVESEKRRRNMSTVYSSYRTARSQYNVSDIPLPEGPGIDDENNKDDVNIVTNIPLPDEPSSAQLMPPGPPPGLPPNIIYPKAINSMIITNSSSSTDNDDTDNDSTDDDNDDDDDDDDESSKQPLPLPLGPPPGLPPNIHYPPPPLFPSHQSTINPYPVIRPSVSSIPHRHPPIVNTSNKSSVTHFQSSAIISKTDKPQNVVISAQPQIRNVQAEVTKFLPTSLRVRRDAPKHVKQGTHSLTLTKPNKSKMSETSNMMKGDAYDAFMKEMQGLI